MNIISRCGYLHVGKKRLAIDPYTKYQQMLKIIKIIIIIIPYQFKFFMDFIIIICRNKM